MTVTELLHDLAGKAAFDTNSEDFKMLISTTSLNGVEVPESVTKAFSKGLMGEAGARNNDAIRTHFQHQYANGLEEKFFGMLQKLGASEQEIETLKTTHTGFGKRLPAAEDVLTRLLNDAKKASGKNANEEHTRVLQELASKHNQEKAEMAKQLEDFQAKIRNTAIEGAYEKHFGKIKLKGIDDGIRNTVLKELVKQWTEEKGALVQFDESTNDFTLKQKAAPDLDFTQDAKPVSFKDFLSLNLQEKSLLDTSPGGSAPSTGHPHIIPPNQGGSTTLQTRAAQTTELFKM